MDIAAHTHTPSPLPCSSHAHSPSPPHPPTRHCLPPLARARAPLVVHKHSHFAGTQGGHIIPHHGTCCYIGIDTVRKRLMRRLPLLVRVMCCGCPASIKPAGGNRPCSAHTHTHREPCHCCSPRTKLTRPPTHPPKHPPQVVQHIPALHTETGSRNRSPAAVSACQQLNFQPLQRSRSDSQCSVPRQRAIPGPSWCFDV